MNWLKKGDKVKMLCNVGFDYNCTKLEKGKIYTIDAVDKADPDTPYHVADRFNSRWVCSDQFVPVKEFRIGSRIRLTKDRSHAHKGMTGTIVADMEYGDWGVKFDEKFDGGHALNGECEYGYGHWIAPDEMELLEPTEEEKSKFKVGDRVVMTKGDETVMTGMKGTLLDDGPYCFGVCFDDDIGGHSCGGRCKNGHGWKVPFNSFKLIPKFEVGQTYRVEKAITEDWNGSIIKISGEEQKCFGRRFTTKAVRGKSPDSFDEGSMFANEIVLLTGKEIGEAIRKWDTDHAKKEPEYNEVKRAAKVGEKIKVVNAYGNPTYDNGDILTVTYVFGSGVRVEPDADGIVAYLSNCEYVVLEPRVKEVKRKADIGEYIKIVAPWYTDRITRSDYAKGDILQVRGFHWAGNALVKGLGDDKFIAPEEYVVLEGYKPTEDKVKEVKREAKPGEYIKLADALYSFDRVGDILKMGADGRKILGANHPRHGHENCCDDSFAYCYPSCVYVVLEGYKPEQKAPAKAKVGDTIQITKDCGGPATPGKSGKVVSVSEDCAFVQLPPHIGSMFIPYGIEHGSYRILSSGKHSYTAEQIAEAKKLCGKMMVEAFDEASTQVVRFADRANGITLYADNVTCEIGSCSTNRSGEAKCSDHDEYSIWIGRCVALCKALHKPIPAFIMGD